MYNTVIALSTFYILLETSSFLYIFTEASMFGFLLYFFVRFSIYHISIHDMYFSALFSRNLHLAGCFAQNLCFPTFFG